MQTAGAVDMMPPCCSSLLVISVFINEYRIETAKTLLKTNPNLKMEIIAEQSGFNSNSTFYAAFKKVTNTTPAKYAKNQVS